MSQSTVVLYIHLYEATIKKLNDLLAIVKHLSGLSGMPLLMITSQIGYLEEGFTHQTIPEAQEIHFISVEPECLTAFELARHLRFKKPQGNLVFLLNSVDEVSYCVRPTIKPTGILFKPLVNSALAETLKEIHALSVRENEVDQGRYVVKCGGDYHRIQYDQITFFEARTKRIAIKTGVQEILFYSNFESLLEKLPETFIRCHKGFIVNMKRLKHINFTEMKIFLDDGSIIPLSRTYKTILKTHFLEEEGSDHG